MTSRGSQPTGNQPIAATRRDVLKYVVVAGAGMATLTSPLSRRAAALQATPVPGGTLNVGVAAELKVLDPHITTLAAYATTMRFTVFETLVEVFVETNLAGRRRGAPVTRDGDEVERHARLETAHEVGEEDEAALQDANQMDAVVFSVGGVDFGGQCVDAFGNVFGGDEDVKRVRGHDWDITLT